MTYGEPDKWDKIVPIVCGVIMVAFLISVPFMIRDNNRRAEKAWQDTGCQMYDEERIENVPAKCQTYFTDHYKPQAARTQPPETPCIYYRDFPKAQIPARCLSPEGDFRAE